MPSVGPYEITGETLGQGGMGKVYRALQSSVNREVALKVLSPALQSDPEAVVRFRREAETAGNLRHPNIVQVWDASLSDPPYYIAMEYLAGGTLQQLAARGPLPAAQAAAIVTQLSSALDYAHQQGIVHRDIKPANIMFDRADRPVLTDFGIVRVTDQTRLTVDGAKFGTPDYMSPEQAKGQPLDGRADLYSLGVVFYELVTGRVPFTGEPITVMYQVVHEPAPAPSRVRGDLPASLDGLIATALAKRREDRFQSGAEFATALREALQHPDPRRWPKIVSGKPARVPKPVSPTTPSRTPVTGAAGRKKAVVALALVAVIACALGLGLAWSYLASRNGPVIPIRTEGSLVPPVQAGTTPNSPIQSGAAKAPNTVEAHASPQPSPATSGAKGTLAQPTTPEPSQPPTKPGEKAAAKSPTAQPPATKVPVKALPPLPPKPSEPPKVPMPPTK